MNPLVRLVDDDNDFRSSQELFLGMCGFETIGYSVGGRQKRNISVRRI